MDKDGSTVYTFTTKGPWRFVGQTVYLWLFTGSSYGVLTVFSGVVQNKFKDRIFQYFTLIKQQ